MTDFMQRDVDIPVSSPDMSTDVDMVGLIYIGNGRYVLGVPTTDLTVDPDEADRLIATGLYRRANARPIKGS